MKNKIILISILFYSSCESPNYKLRDKELGFHKLPCDNIEDIKVLKYPEIFNSLIDEKLIDIVKDSIVDHRILGVEYPMNLENCRIDKSKYNVTVKVITLNSKEFWVFLIKKENNKFILFGYYKYPQVGGRGRVSD